MWHWITASPGITLNPSCLPLTCPLPSPSLWHSNIHLLLYLLLLDWALCKGWKWAGSDHSCLLEEHLDKMKMQFKWHVNLWFSTVRFKGGLREHCTSFCFISVGYLPCKWAHWQLAGKFSVSILDGMLSKGERLSEGMFSSASWWSGVWHQFRKKASHLFCHQAISCFCYLLLRVSRPVMFYWSFTAVQEPGSSLWGLGRPWDISRS